MQHVHQNTYRLHAIVLSRSPLLAHLMSTSPQTGAQRVIHVQLEHEPEVSQEVRVSFLTLFPATECGAEIRRASMTPARHLKYNSNFLSYTTTVLGGRAGRNFSSGDCKS